MNNQILSSTTARSKCTGTERSFPQIFRQDQLKIDKKVDVNFYSLVEEQKIVEHDVSRFVSCGTQKKKNLKKGRVSWPWIQEILSFNIASIACYGIWHGINCQKFYDSLKRVLQHIMVPYSATSLTRDVQINRHFIFGICDIIKSRFGFWLDTNTKGIQLVGTAGKQLRCFGGIEDVLEDVTERYA